MQALNDTLTLLPQWPALLAAVAIAALGAAVQASMGFGMAMIAAPLLLLLDPAFIPGPMVVAILLLAAGVAWQERSAIEGHTLPAALAGRVVGCVPAIALLGTLSAVAFDLVFASLVLLAVLLSLLHPNLPRSRANVFGATLASGFMETLSGIGGPPIALVYQHARGPALRANLSILFATGNTISLIGLIAIGRFGLRETLLTGVLLVGTLLGMACKAPLQRYLDQRSARPYLLGLCALSALLVLGRAAWTAMA